MESDTQVNLPGRLGDPDRLLKTDERTDPRMRAALAVFDLDGAPAPLPVTWESPLAEKRSTASEMESGFEGIFDALFQGLPAVEEVSTSTETVVANDGHSIPLYIHRPAQASGPIPCIVHLHGGGMTILAADGSNYRRWRNELAAQGMLVVGVEYRNAAGKLGSHPFPTGLEDCSVALNWVYENRQKLGVSKIVLSGESGGGNLALAMTLKAKQEGHLNQIAGVYALCPYISGLYATKHPALVSLYENDDYFLGCDMMAVLSSLYDPTGDNTTNPLCWPYFASGEDLKGLPPHVISVNELDPLRDEGLAYFRKLLQVGVPVVGRTINGTCHAADTIFRQAMPDVYAATIQDLSAFATAL